MAHGVYQGVDEATSGSGSSSEDEKSSVLSEDPDSFEVLSETTWSEKLSLGLGSLLALLQGASAPMIAMYTGQCINILSTSNPGNVLSEMQTVLISISILALVQFLLAFLWQTCLMWAAGQQALRWQLRYLKSVFTLDVTWFDLNEAAGLAAKLEGDIAAVHSFMSAGLGFLISSVGQFVSGLALAFVHGWQLTLIVISAMPVLICAGHGLSKQIERQMTQQAEDFARAGGVAEESLMAVRTVAAFGAELSQQRRFERELLTAQRGGVRSGVRIGIFWAAQNFAYACLYALTLWFGGHILLAPAENREALEGGDVIIVLIALITGMTGVSSFAGFAPALAKAVIAAKALKQIIRYKDRSIEPGDFHQEEIPGLAEIQSIEFRGVCFNYPSRPEKAILNQLSFFITQGQKVAFVGESGCGKSTTIQMLERFYDPIQGEIMVNGRPLRSWPVRSWRQKLGYVGQHPVLFATSAMENIKAGAEISDEDAIEAARMAQILDTLSALPEGLETNIGAAGGTLSGGQRQRVAIARALAKKPKVLLLDEATSALDNESERMVQATLDSLDLTMGRSLTSVSIAHRLTTVVNSDMIYVLDSGHCLEQGTHAELMARKGQYFNMASLQQAVESKRQISFPRQHSVHSGASAAIQMSVQKAAPGTFASQASWLQLPTIANEAAPAELATPVLSRLFFAARAEWVVIPFALLAVVLQALCAPFQAYFFNAGIMSYYEKSVDVMLEKLDLACLGLAVIGVASGACVLLQNSLFTYIQECITLVMRKRAFGSTIRMHMGFFDAPENQTSSILVSLERHMTRLSQMFGVGLAMALGSAMTCVASVLFSFFGSWILALVLLLLLPIFFGVSMGVTTAAHRPDSNSDKAWANASHTTTEAVTSIRTVRALGAEEHTLDILTTALQVVADHNRSSACKKAFAFGFTTSLIQLIYLVGFWLSAAMINSGRFEANAVLLTLFCVVFGVMTATTVAMYLPDSASGRIAAMEVFRLIDQHSKIDAVEPEGKICSFGDGTICLKKVDFYYPSRAETMVLKHLSLTIWRGQKVAFCGFSGSGKSTVIQLLLRFYDPQGGSITLGGTEIRDFNVAWYRRQLGLVAQQPLLFDISLEDNVKYGCPDATREQVREAARLANMTFVEGEEERWSQKLGLRGERLSGGQRQRVAIARALLRKPQILLLDEATSDLDSTSEALVQEALQRASKGVTTVTVAHRLSTIRDSDQIFVLLDGQVIEQGTYQELVALGGNFAKLAARSL
ncbi:unnamed protein product [Effrenium voratum]|uniref:Uncharacterized protein n=1 Tax=Effrenium voratum TaxID=2562239 RepID=A0AA36J655_9DINO|nr:unnamed protein product [Effrenium voratum]CAJ1447772.1 unnamed protein product [Effrenium voratum]